VQTEQQPQQGTKRGRSPADEDEGGEKMVSLTSFSEFADRLLM
jgi:hypothetical protein